MCWKVVTSLRRRLKTKTNRIYKNGVGKREKNPVFRVKMAERERLKGEREKNRRKHGGACVCDDWKWPCASLNGSVLEQLPFLFSQNRSSNYLKSILRDDTGVALSKSSHTSTHAKYFNSGVLWWCSYPHIHTQPNLDMWHSAKKKHTEISYRVRVLNAVTKLCSPKSWNGPFSRYPRLK